MNLNSDNFAVLLDLEAAFTALRNTSLFASSEVMRERHSQVVSGLTRLSTAYPETNQKVTEYYEEDTDPIFTQDDEETLFRLLLNLRVFSESETLRDVSYAVDETRVFLVQFAALFEDFDSERHFC